MKQALEEDHKVWRQHHRVTYPVRVVVFSSILSCIDLISAFTCGTSCCGCCDRARWHCGRYNCATLISVCISCGCSADCKALRSVLSWHSLCKLCLEPFLKRILTVLHFVIDREMWPNLTITGVIWTKFDSPNLAGHPSPTRPRLLICLFSLLNFYKRQRLLGHRLFFVLFLCPI